MGFQESLEQKGTVRHLAVTGSTLTFVIATAAAVATKAVRVLSYNLTVNKAVTMRIESADGDDLTGSFGMRTNWPLPMNFSPAGHFQGNAGERLVAVLSTNALVKGHITVQDVTL